MPKPTAQGRRIPGLGDRRSDGQQFTDAGKADQLFADALGAYSKGDFASADRNATAALVFDPGHVPSLNILAQVHHRAGRFAEAISCLLRLRELTNDPSVLYNLGMMHRALDQPKEAAEAMQAFLIAVRGRPRRVWQQVRPAAERIAGVATPEPQPRRKAAVPPAARRAASGAAPKKPAAPAPSASEPEPTPEPPRAAVHFPEAPAPAYTACGSVADYFLRRRWIDLRLAQNFDDLLCLPSLHGVDTYIYQQETVRRVLRHFKGRALLADEVGLGKTIEACLVLKEYWTRGLVRKALILTPPSLVSQWKGELTEKFGLVPVSPDTPEFRRDAARFWKDEPLVVASIAMARLDANASAIRAAGWDIVIVDEAHCLKNRTSANWQLVDSLHKKFILMLSATPVENSLIELYNLITLLKPGLLSTEADFRKTYVSPGKLKSPKNPEQLRSLLREVMIRNTRAAADVQLPRRIAATVAVSPSEAESRLYDLVSRFVACHYRRKGGGAAAWGLDQMQRQAGSSRPALARSVANALRGDGWTRPEDRRDLEAILEIASSSGESAKGAQLGRMLAAHPGKTVVFTEFLPTLDHLREVCREHAIPFAVFSGDLSRAEKDEAIARFRDQAKVLLSTGAGGEGRNLQFADTIVNFDLPWNPMRIEQRVGRVHRIGQTHEVFVFNFCQQGSVEEQLLRVLHDKINMFELVVGEMDAILGTLDDSREFADIVMDLWVSGREAGRVEDEFETLAARLLEAKKQQDKVKELDQSLFGDDFEV